MQRKLLNKLLYTLEKDNEGNLTYPDPTNPLQINNQIINDNTNI